MICPLCGKEMKQTYWEGWSTLNPMTCEDRQECVCVCEFSYGAERCLDKDGNEIDY